MLSPDRTGVIIARTPALSWARGPQTVFRARDMRLAGRRSGPMFDGRHDHGEERQRMTDDTELYGADGGRRDGFDREYLMLMQMAREQKLRLWQDRGVFRLDDAGDDTVFKTDQAGPGAAG